MNTAIGIQNATLSNTEEQQPTDTNNTTQTTTTNTNSEDNERGISPDDGSIKIISDPLTGSVNVAESTIDDDNMNSTMANNTNENEQVNNNELESNNNNSNTEGIEDETDNQCQLWSSNQPPAEHSGDDTPIQQHNTQSATATDNVFGDIWSTEAFSYYNTTSPLKDLLDSNNYTLYQLLEQDELLQELRGCEVKLIDYFSKGEVVAELIEMLLVDVPHDMDGVGGKEYWIKEEMERRANLKWKKVKQQQQGKRSYAQALESPENKLQDNDAEGLEGITFDASSPNQLTATLDINTPNGSSPTFLPSPDNGDEEVGNEQQEKDEEERTPLEEYEMRFIRYPYMACEVICSEIGSTIDVLVDGYVDDDMNTVEFPTQQATVEEEGIEGRRTSETEIDDEEDSLLDEENNETMKEVKIGPSDESGDENDDVPVLDLFVNGTSNSTTQSLAEASASAGVPPIAPKTIMNPSLPTNTQQKQQQQPKKRILDILFSTLQNTPPNSITNRKSGYFERILNMLYMKRSTAMCDYMNNTTLLISNDVCLNMVHDILGNLSMEEQEKMIMENNGGGSSIDCGGNSSSDYISFSRQTRNSGNSDNTSDVQAATPTNVTTSCANKFPSPHAPPMLMCALFDQLHSYSIMHIVQRLILPSPSRIQSSISSKNLKEEGENAISAESKESASNENNSNDTTNDEEGKEEEDNPTNAMNDQFMNTLNQINGLGPMFGDDDDDDDDDDMDDDPMNQIFQCDWSTQYTSQALELLLRRLEGDTTSFLLGYGFPVGYNVDPTTTKVEEEDAEMKEVEEQQQQKDEQEESLSCSQHASEILITIIQNSPLNSPVMISLSSNPTIKRIIDLICSPTGIEEFTAHESILTCAITVLENLVLQLGGYGAVAASTQTSTSNNNGGGDTSAQDAGQNRQPDTAVVANISTLLQHAPALLTRLSTLLTHPITETWTIPAQYSNSQPRAILGTSRLKILRLLESLVLLGDPSIDLVLEQSDCLEKCLNLFWQFEWCSILHQSAANLLVHVFEGGESRCGLQKYFLIRCGLLHKLIGSFGCDDNITTNSAVKSSSGEEGNQETMGEAPSPSPNPSNDDIDIQEATDDVVPVSEDDVDSAMEKEVQEQGDAIAAGSSTDESGDLVTINSSTFPPQERGPVNQTFRRGYMGHVIIICQALVHACNSCSEEVDLDDAIGDTGHTMEEEQETSGTVDTTTSSLDTSDIQAAAHDINDDASSSSNSKKRKDRSPVRDGDEDIKRLASSPSCSDGGSTSPIPISSSAQSSSNGEETDSKQSQPTESQSIDNILRQHPLFEKWENFVSTQLASEMNVQSTPLGGQQTSDQGGGGVNSISVIDDNSDSDFLGLDQDIPSAIGNGSIGGLMVGEIDMDENDLEIAVGMMEALNIPPSNGGDGNRRRRRPPSADAGCNFGAKIEQPGGFKDYVYDDPLGGIHPFDNAGSSDEEENDADGDGSPDNDSEDDGFMVVASSDGTKPQSSTTDSKDGSTKQPESNSSSEESDDDNEESKDDDDVPVLDLFQGSSFDDFANFDAFSDNGGADPFGDVKQDSSGSADDLFGSSSGDKKDDDPFQSTPFDLVDSLSSSNADDKAEL